MDQLTKEELPLPVEIIFSCAICQATTRDIYRDDSSRESNELSTDSTSARSSTKLWVTGCCHPICSTHLEGGAPSYGADEKPYAVCPICDAEQGDKSKKELFSITGTSVRSQHPDIPSSWFVVPPMKLDGQTNGIEALRFHYISLIRFGTNILARYRKLKKSFDHNTKQLEERDKEQQRHARELQHLQNRIKEIESCEKEARIWRERSPKIKHYLNIFTEVTRENEKLREQLSAMGYAVPIRTYNLEDDAASSSTDDNRLQNTIAMHNNNHRDAAAGAARPLAHTSSSETIPVSAPLIGNLHADNTSAEPTQKRRRVEESSDKVGQVRQEHDAQDDRRAVFKVPPVLLPTLMSANPRAPVTSTTQQNIDHFPPASQPKLTTSRATLKETPSFNLMDQGQSQVAPQPNSRSSQVGSIPLSASNDDSVQPSFRTGSHSNPHDPYNQPNYAPAFTKAYSRKPLEGLALPEHQARGHERPELDSLNIVDHNHFERPQLHELTDSRLNSRFPPFQSPVPGLPPSPHIHSGQQRSFSSPLRQSFMQQQTPSPQKLPYTPHSQSVTSPFFGKTIAPDHHGRMTLPSRGGSRQTARQAPQSGISLHNQSMLDAFRMPPPPRPVDRRTDASGSNTNFDSHGLGHSNAQPRNSSNPAFAMPPPVTPMQPSRDYQGFFQRPDSRLNIADGGFPPSSPYFSYTNPFPDYNESSRTRHIQPMIPSTPSLYRLPDHANRATASRGMVFNNAAMQHRWPDASGGRSGVSRLSKEVPFSPLRGGGSLRRSVRR